MVSNRRPSSAALVGVAVFLAVLATLVAAPAQAQCVAGQDGPTVVDISVYYPQSPVTVTVDGVPLGYESIAPLIVNGRVFVEMKALYNALGLDISFIGYPTYKLTGTKCDLEVVVCLGTRTAHKTIAGFSAPNLLMDDGAFIASGYGKTLVPASFIAQAAGAIVDWNGSTRTVTITSGRTWLFDWNGSSGTYVQYTDLRQLGPGHTLAAQTCTCPSGSFDYQTKYCSVSGSSQGNFPAWYRSRCSALGYGNCSSTSWPAAQTLEIKDTAIFSSGWTTTQIIDHMKSNPEVHGVPLENNDIVSEGLYSDDGTDDQFYTRSENPAPPFVYSARRQTDSMIRSLYLTLPSSVRTTTAFLHPDRVVREPDAYLPYIRKKNKAWLAGIFMGPGGVSSTSDPKYRAVIQRHERELFALRTTLALLNREGITVEGVLYSLGDTTDDNPVIRAIQSDLQTRFDRTLTAAGYGHLAGPVTFGGDELMAVAFARSLGTTPDVFIRVSNDQMSHRYDALRTTRQILDEKIPEVGINELSTRTGADFEVHILTREPQIGTKIANGWSRCTGGTYDLSDWLYQGFAPGNNGGFRCTVDQSAQATHDASFMGWFSGYTAADRADTFVVDARSHNGSWNDTAVPSGCDWLGYSGWGTGANNIGQSLAVAKLLHDARGAGRITAAQVRRLFLEAVAHDVYANGYEDGQRGTFRNLVQSYGISFNHHPGYTNPNHTYTVFNLLSSHVSSEMKSEFFGTGCIPTTYGDPFKHTAQMWRTFESEVHLWPVGPGEVLTPGLYRTGTVPGTSYPMQNVLDPTVRGPGAVTRVDMAYLLAE